jgi:hypothetical protein
MKATKKIKLSIIAAKYIWPMWIDPISALQDQFANKILHSITSK